MMRFRGKYRIASTRLKGWDYGWDAAYFITICTQDRVCFFGEVQNGEMKWNTSGQIANTIWIKIPQQFPYAELGNFVVMPNHIHGILIINKSSVQTRLIASQPKRLIASQPKRLIASQPKRLIASQPKRLIASPPSSLKLSGGITGNKNPMLQDNISRIIRWYKGRCTFEIRKTNPVFGWQPRFYDNIVRSDQSFHRISNYIMNNPKQWSRDKFNIKK